MIWVSSFRETFLAIKDFWYMNVQYRRDREPRDLEHNFYFKITEFWDVGTCGVVHVYQSSEETSYLHFLSWGLHLVNPRLWNTFPWEAETPHGSVSASMYSINVSCELK